MINIDAHQALHVIRGSTNTITRAGERVNTSNDFPGYTAALYSVLYFSLYNQHHVLKCLAAGRHCPNDAAVSALVSSFSGSLTPLTVQLCDVELGSLADEIST